MLSLDVQTDFHNKLDVGGLKRFIANLQNAENPLRDLAEYLDKCAADLHIGAPLLGSKNFTLGGEEWEGREEELSSAIRESRSYKHGSRTFTPCV